MYLKPILILALFNGLTLACSPSGNGEQAKKGLLPSQSGGSGLEKGSVRPNLNASSKYDLEYDLGGAVSQHKLPSKLKEISGLSLSADGAYLLAINDEEGMVYFLDKGSGRILGTFSFGPPGDYECLEAVGSHIYIGRSDGVIFEVEYKGKHASPASRELDTGLNADYDIEGLGHDPANRRLLVACKGIAGEGAEFKDKRAVYAFSLDSMRLLPTPVLLLGEDMPVAKEAFREAWWSDVLKGQFVPSAIAVHPVTGHVYVLSSKGKARALLVMKPSGELLVIRELDKELFNQPEGICFEPDGTMYISTEAKGKRGRGRFFRFRML